MEPSLGFNVFDAVFPGVRRCHGDPRLCCETPLGLIVHGQDVGHVKASSRGYDGMKTRTTKLSNRSSTDAGSAGAESRWPPAGLSSADTLSQAGSGDFKTGDVGSDKA